MNNETQSNQIINVMNGKYSQAIFLGLVILLIGASFYIGKLTTQVEMMKEGIQNNPAYDRAAAEGQQLEEKLGDVEKPNPETDHIQGNVNAKFALIEYSDYECPFCQKFHPTAKQVLDEYGDKIMWVFRHFPLDFHPEAKPTAIASECISKIAGNDAFWKFSDLMFEKTDSLSAKVRQDAAVSLGVNLDLFNSCVEDPEMSRLVDQDLDTGMKAGIRGTPGNIIMNIETGETSLISGAQPFPLVKASIDKLMANE